MILLRIHCILGVFFLFTLGFSWNVFPEQGRKTGGYAIGYPRQSQVVAPTYAEKEQVLMLPETRVVSQEIVRTSEGANDVREKLIVSLQRQLSGKDATINLLQKRVNMLEQSIQDKDAALYLMQPKPAPLYEVKKGDSLWKIAKRKDTYGNPYMWIKIYNANMEKIKKPSEIYPGQLFEIPK